MSIPQSEPETANYLLELYEKTQRTRKLSNTAYIAIPAYAPQRSVRGILETQKWCNIINPPLGPAQYDDSLLVRDIDDRLDKQSMEFCRLEQQLYRRDLQQKEIEDTSTRTKRYTKQLDTNLIDFTPAGMIRVALHASGLG